MKTESDLIFEFEFYCPFCDAGYDNYYALVFEPTNRIDKEIKCEVCSNTFRLQAYQETVIETSQKLK